MSIRARLLLLAIGTQLMMAFALLLNYAITSPVERLRTENDYFQKAAQKADELLGAANELATMGLKPNSRSISSLWTSIKNR